MAQLSDGTKEALEKQAMNPNDLSKEESTRDIRLSVASFRTLLVGLFVANEVLSISIHRSA
jgi:hypothetical protein